MSSDMNMTTMDHNGHHGGHMTTTMDHGSMDHGSMGGDVSDRMKAFCNASTD